MPTQAIYQFNAGVNYRDKQKAINELSTAMNVRWTEGALTRRKGYAPRASALSLGTVYSAGSVLNILEHAHYKYGSDERYFLFASIDAGGGAVADKVVVFEAAGIPAAASAFTVLGTAYAMDWTVGDAFDIVQKFNKIYIATDANNPYVLHFNALGTAFNVTELPLLNDLNDGSSTAGYTAGDQIIVTADWRGCQWVDVADVGLYLCDGESMFYALCRDADDDPAIDITGNLAARIAGVVLTWRSDYYRVVDRCAPHTATGYKSYLFLGGENGTWRWLNRSTEEGEDWLDEIADVGVRGEIKGCIAGVFWVSDDGIYFHNGMTTHNIGLKIWEHIKTQHATLPADLDDVSIEYFKGWIWISFPNSTDKEIWAFDPKSVYQAKDGNLYAAFYKFMYNITDLDTKKGFSVLRVIQDRLFVTDGASFYELEIGTLDNESAATGINTIFETADLDFGSPNKKKVYGDLLLECDANLETRLSHVITLTRDFGEETATITGIDTTYTSAQRAKVENRIGYQIDGNAMRVKIAGTAPSASAGTGEVRYYGLSIDANAEEESIIERD